MRKMKFVVALGGGAVACALCLSLNVLATSDNRADLIKSNGVLNVQNGAQSIELNSSDLVLLANEIDALELAYKTSASQSLTAVGQTISSDKWSDICFAIEHSQDIEGETIAANLSKDKQAWVEGNLVVGTGADVDNAYNKGFADGKTAAMGGLSVQYIYHQHTSACVRTCTYTGGKFFNGRGGPPCYRGCGTAMDDYCFSEGGHTCNPYLNRTRHDYRCYNCDREPSDADSDWPSWGCGTFTHTYYACGKSTSTIEKATIIFN